MAGYQIEDLSFTYSTNKQKSLDNLSLEISDGEFICLCGQSGCGKTTFLRMLKPVLSPYGKTEGKIYFDGKNLSDLTNAQSASRIGFVMQDIDGQIVTDKVWHELAFGLESLGIPNTEIRSRVSEIAEFFGISNWFYRDVCDLSGGEKQLLNLASVMVMMPDVLILDEPTSQLDPISAKEFISILSRLNRELGITVILSEHRLEDVFALSDRVVVMDRGKVIACGTPKEIGKVLSEINHPMERALPTPMQIYNAICGGNDVPITVREGRGWLSTVTEKKVLPVEEHLVQGDTAVLIKDAYFRYERNMPDVIKGLSLEAVNNEIYAVVGGNGVGKSTMLSLISGINKPYKGKVKTMGVVATLPQNPGLLFVEHTIGDELKDSSYIDFCEIDSLLCRHPQDLSGGEIQRAALAKVLMREPDILLLDEPTKGLDSHFKIKLAKLLRNLADRGMSVIIVSHDIEFVAKYADRCSMFFDGSVTATSTPQKMFSKNSFYTTATVRMSRGIIDNAVVLQDIIKSLGEEND